MKLIKSVLFRKLQLILLKKGVIRMIANLKKLRAKKGISQQTLANVIGVSQQSVNKYENHNVEPEIRALMAMADYFGTSVDYLIGHTDIPNVIEAVHPHSLNAQEEAMMEGFRNLTEAERSSILQIVENYNRYK